jgi:hypothetical protein
VKSTGASRPAYSSAPVMKAMKKCLESGRVEQACPVPRFSNSQPVTYDCAAPRAHKINNAGIVETDNVTGQAGLGSFPSKDAKVRACKGLLSCHAADALSGCGIREVTGELAPLRDGIMSVRTRNAHASRGGGALVCRNNLLKKVSVTAPYVLEKVAQFVFIVKAGLILIFRVIRLTFGRRIKEFLTIWAKYSTA